MATIITVFQDGQPAVRVTVNPKEIEPNPVVEVGEHIPLAELSTLFMRAMLSVVMTATGGADNQDIDIDIGRGPNSGAKA